MDIELSTIWQNIEQSVKASQTSEELSDEIFWTPVELVKTSFPEKKADSLRWIKQFGYHSLHLQQLEDDRAVPYGMMAREIFDYFFNSFVVNLNQDKVNPNSFFFSSVAEFVNEVKGKPQGTKVSTDQRVLALEMLLNMESCTIRFKKPIGNNRGGTNNNLFIRRYSGPSHKKVAILPEDITDGHIKIELDFETFADLVESKKVPTKLYLVDLAGSSVMARDLIVFIASQCYSLVKRSKEYIDYEYKDLNQILGKGDDVTVEQFNKDLKRAVRLLQKNYEKKFPNDFFPAEVIQIRRGKVVLRIYKPQYHRNILCA